MSPILLSQNPRHFALPLMLSVRRLGHAVLYFEAEAAYGLEAIHLFGP